MTEALPELVDTHCHLTWESFDEDLDDVVGRMRAAGVAQAVVVATDPETSRRTRELCRDRDGLFPTAGLHPNGVTTGWRAELDEIERLLAESDYVGVGETGLDDYRDWAPFDAQRDSFAAHADLAVRLDLPLIVHIRDRRGRVVAYDDVATILRATPGCARSHPLLQRRPGARGAVPRRRLPPVVLRHRHLQERGRAARGRAAATPSDRLLVETDAPFLAPDPWRGKRNEPAYVAATAACIAKARGVPEEELRRVTTDNARALFRLPETTRA